MWWLYNTENDRWLTPVGHVKASMLNSFVRDFFWLEVRKAPVTSRLVAPF